MLKQINISHMEQLTSQLESALADGYTHFAPYANEIKIHQDMLKSVTLHPHPIVVDYTINGEYLNDCRYFGQAQVDFKTWSQNINHYPNLVYHIPTALHHLSTDVVHNIFDLALMTLLFDDVVVDGHVAYDFTQPIQASETFWTWLADQQMNSTNYFELNKLAYQQYQAIPFPQPQYKDDSSKMRFADSWLVTTKFKLPKWLYNMMHQHAVNNHKKLSYLYQKDTSKVKDHVVFLGFDHGYRGNSKYLFNHFIKRNPMVDTYFITNERKGPNFISTSAENKQELIESAKVVVIESYMPDTYHPNGTIIQLWHGSPIKRLFLDSAEPYENSNIYNYRARKYNKWLQQDYLVVDATSVVPYFNSAFPNQETNVLPVGYPRVDYLLQHRHDRAQVKHISKKLHITDDKPVLLYAPTWHKDTVQQHLTITDDLLQQYHIIFKGHVEAQQDYSLPERVIRAPKDIETQDLILIADIIVTDYSSIIFDALTIDKKVCLFTPQHETYQQERGIYEHVLSALRPVWYKDEALLHEDLIEQRIPSINHPFVNKSNHALAEITDVILKELHKKHADN